MTPYINLLATIGSILALWGIIWQLWDYNAKAPSYILLSALTILSIYVTLQ